jgi:hypothetical protein
VVRQFADTIQPSSTIQRYYMTNSLVQATKRMVHEDGYTEEGTERKTHKLADHQGLEVLVDSFYQKVTKRDGTTNYRKQHIEVQSKHSLFPNLTPVRPRRPSIFLFFGY